MRGASTLAFMTLASLVSLNAAHADDTLPLGPYAGIGLGQSRFDVSDSAHEGGNDVEGGAVKLYGGYQITQHFGVEAGFMRTSNIVADRMIDGESIRQRAKTRAYYVAGTARWPLSDSFSVTGRLGVTRGEVESDTALPENETLVGRKTSVIAGVGAQYQLFSSVSLFADVDHIHEESERIGVNTLTVGFRKSF